MPVDSVKKDKSDLYIPVHVKYNVLHDNMGSQA